MKTSEILIAQCDDHIAKLESTKAMIRAHAALFDQCSDNSSVGCCFPVNRLLLHPPFFVETRTSEWRCDVRELARSIGGEWVAENSNDGLFLDFKNKGEQQAVIFSAEPQPQPKPLVI